MCALLKYINKTGKIFIEILQYLNWNFKFAKEHCFKNLET